MIKKIYKTIFIILTPFLLSGCFGETTEESKTENITESKEYSLNIPKDWEIFPKEEYPKSIIFSAREPAYSSLIPSIIVVSKENSIPQSLEQFVNRNLESIRIQSQDFKEIFKEKIDKESFEAYFIEYSERKSMDNSLIKFYSLYVLPKNNESVYIVTILFDGNTKEEKYSNLKNILLSFKLE
jgi:hypothetical protein